MAPGSRTDASRAPREAAKPSWTATALGFSSSQTAQTCCRFAQDTSQHSTPARSSKLNFKVSKMRGHHGISMNESIYNLCNIFIYTHIYIYYTHNISLHQCPQPSSSGGVGDRGRIFGFTSESPSNCAIGRQTSLLGRVGMSRLCFRHGPRLSKTGKLRLARRYLDLLGNRQYAPTPTLPTQFQRCVVGTRILRAPCERLRQESNPTAAQQPPPRSYQRRC